VGRDIGKPVLNLVGKGIELESPSMALYPWLLASHPTFLSEEDTVESL